MFNLNCIRDVAVSNNILYIADGIASILRIDLEQPTAIIEVQLPKKPEGGSISKIFADSTGKHLIVVTSKFEHFYYNSASGKLSHLSKLHGIQTSCVAWSSGSITASERIVLLGTSNGTIYETAIDPSRNDIFFRREVRSLRKIWTSPGHESIKGIQLLNDSDANCILVLSSTTLYAWFDFLADGQSNSSDIYKGTFTRQPMVQEVSSAGFRNPQLQASPTGEFFAAFAGENIIYGSIHSLKKNECLTRTLPRDTQIILSNYNLIAVESEKNTVESFSLFNGQFTSQMSLFLGVSEKMCGCCCDQKHGTLWAFSRSSLIEMKFDDEEKDVWQILVKEHQFKRALEISTREQDRREIYSCLAEYEKNKGNLKEAARCLGLSGKPLEALALQLMKQGALEELAELFKSRLSIVKKNKAQQVALTSWIAHFYLDTNNIQGFCSLVDDELDKMDQSTIKQILRQHANEEALLYFAQKTEDSKCIIEHWIQKDEWMKALEAIRQYENLDLVHKFAALLLEKAPRETVESWMRIQSIDPVKMLPAITRYSLSFRGPINENQAVRYLKFLVYDCNSTLDAVLNTLLVLYALEKDEDDLIDLLQSKANALPNLDFALRTCLLHRKPRSSIFLYTMMGFFEEAVDLALAEGFLEQAKEIVEKHVDQDETKKHLWLKIASKTIHNKGPDEAMKLIGELNIEELIKLLPSFDSLEKLRPNLVKALQRADGELSAINKEIKQSLTASETVHDEIIKFNNRHMLVEPGEPCNLCMYPLATRNFYIFPCQHGFHADCVVDYIRGGRNEGAKDRLSKALSDKPGYDKIYTPEIDAIVSEQCVLCDPDQIENIDKPIIGKW